MKFCDKLIELRKVKGFSQEELGYRLDVTRQTVSKWETGQTTPEMNKLIELSKLFGISIDELVGSEPPESGVPTDNGGSEENAAAYIAFHPRFYHYEYKSKRTLFGLPLVHVNMGVGIRRAKGIIAIGTVAQGVIAFGVVSVGVISFGALSLGLLALGALGVGAVALGGAALGLLASGGISVGLLSFGGIAIGEYAMGCYARAVKIAMGGYARGHVAIGDAVRGEFVWEKITSLTKEDYAQIRAIILREYPNIGEWVLNLFGGY